MSETPTSLTRLLRSVRAVKDSALHGAAVERFLTGTTPGEAVETLRILMTNIDQPGYRQAYQAVVNRVFHDGGSDYVGLQELYRAAYGAGYDPVRMLLLRAPAMLKARPDEVLPDPEMLDVPLGRRKTMAKSQDRTLLVRLSLDPTPSVVEILLANSRLLERDVIKMAARRPSMSRTLEIIAANPRWGRAYKVQLSLAQNPYTPSSLAAALVPLLTASDLAHVHRDLRLHQVVRESATMVLDWRRQARGRLYPHNPGPAKTH